MPETFPDGFPMTPAEAIEFSYFLSDNEKHEWMDWITTANQEEITEMINTLHGIWLDKQKNVIPDQFNNTNNFNQGNINEQFKQPNFPTQPDIYNQNNQFDPNMGQPAQNSFNPQASPQFNPNQGFTPNTQDPFVAPSVPSFNEFSFDNTDSNREQASFSNGQGQPAQTLNSNFNNNSILDQPKPNPADFGLTADTKDPDDDDDDFNFDFDDDFSTNEIKNKTEEEIEPSVANETKDEIKLNSADTLTTEDDDDDFNFDFDEIDSIDHKEDNSESADAVADDTKDEDEVTTENTEDINQTQNNNQSNPSPAKPSVNFSISKVRETATQQELNELYVNYVNSRSSVTATKQDHDQSYDVLMDKVISIVLNFESVADYLEFMTTKLSQMNDTVMKQAEEIQAFQSGQNNYAHDLKQELIELSSRVEVLENRVENDLSNYRSRLDNFEIKFSGQSNSAYTGYDNLLTQIDLLKSKLIRLEKSENQQPVQISPNQKPTNIPSVVPQPHLPLDLKPKENGNTNKPNPLPPKNSK